jgi:predicted RNA-binding protein with PIN domain
MKYIIDGYNFMFRIQEEERKKKLEKARESLIALLDEELSIIKTHVYVVFDSSEQVKDYAQSAFLKHIEVIYAPKGLSADQYIIERLEQSKSPKTLTIVTSDSGLALQCQQLGAKILSIDDFVTLINKRKQKKKSLLKPSYKESTQEIERLRKIFEEKLNE